MPGCALGVLDAQGVQLIGCRHLPASCIVYKAHLDPRLQLFSREPCSAHCNLAWPCTCPSMAFHAFRQDRDSHRVPQVIMATNRIESLDPALIRPGRIDRKIEFPLPDTKTKRRIFNIHTSKMTLAPDVNLEEFIMAKVAASILPCLADSTC